MKRRSELREFITQLGMGTNNFVRLFYTQLPFVIQCSKALYLKQDWKGHSNIFEMDFKNCLNTNNPIATKLLLFKIVRQNYFHGKITLSQVVVVPHVSLTKTTVRNNLLIDHTFWIGLNY